MRYLLLLLFLIGCTKLRTANIQNNIVCYCGGYLYENGISCEIKNGNMNVDTDSEYYQVKSIGIEVCGIYYKNTTSGIRDPYFKDYRKK